MFHLLWSTKEEEVVLLYMSCYSNSGPFSLEEFVDWVATQVVCTANKSIEWHKETFPIYHVMMINTF